MSVFRLDGKTAFITGAGSGIGQAIAELFGAQGAQVVVADIKEDLARYTVSLIESQGGKAHPLTLDVSNENQVRAAIQDTVRLFGRLDILVNNAGISHVGHLLETSVADWDRVMGVNAKGVFLCSRYGVEQMIAQEPRGGVVVSISSVAAQVALDRRFVYSASKAAVLTMTRNIAIDFANQGIRANAICPGTVHTPFVEGYLDQHFKDRKDEMIQQLEARQPVGRMAQPDEIAYAALYLASDEASFVTGSGLIIDGGITAR